MLVMICVLLALEDDGFFFFFFKLKQRKGREISL